MKKVMLTAVGIVLGCAMQALAGHFTDILPPASASGCTPVSNGYDYNCSTDASAPVIVSSAPIAIGIKTLAQIQALTPLFIGEIAVCSNCVESGICISTATNSGAWSIISSTSAAAWPQSCK